MGKMNNKLKLIDVIVEAVNPPWGRFRLKMNTKLSSNAYRFEEAFVRDLERMAAEGKIKYNKLTRELTELVSDSGGEYKLTDDDFKILMRSSNFRKAVMDSFNELNINTSSAAHIGNLTGNFKRIWRLFSEVPPSKIVRGAPAPPNITTYSVVTKNIGDFLRNNKGTSFMLRLFRKYEASMKEWIELEKLIEKEIDVASGKLAVGQGIGPEVKKLNGLILRAREFDKKNPKIFWDSIKGDLLTKKNGKFIIDGADKLVEAVENSKYFTLFRERFASMSPESTSVPSNTISRYDGLVKIFTRPTVGGRPDFWEGVFKATKKFILPTEWANSRVVSMLTLLDTRTINELRFNVNVRGKTMSGVSYFSYKLALIYGIYPLAIQSLYSLFDTLTLQFTYTEEELQELFNGKQSDEFWVNYITILNSNLKRDYKTPADLLWEWSPIINIVRSTQNLTNGKDTIKDRLEEEIRNTKGEIKERASRVKNFYSWLKSSFTDLFSDDESTPSPTPTATGSTTTGATVTDTTSTFIPPPPTDPNQESEEMSDTEVDNFIDTNIPDLKSLIVKPYTVNSDKTVTLYLSGQSDPISTLIKVGGKITIKNSN